MAEADSVFFLLFRMLAAQLPELIPMLLGIVVCLAQWRRYPRPACLGFLGFGLILFASVAGTTVMIVGERWYAEAFDNDALLPYLIWALRSLLIAAGCGLVLWAMLGESKTERASDAEAA